MILKKFIEKLENIRKKHGENMEVVMADNLTVVEPVFMKNYSVNEKVIITDKK